MNSRDHYTPLSIALTGGKGQRHVIFGPSDAVTEGLIGLIQQCSIKMLAAEVRVHFQISHESQIARTDDLERRIGLDMKQMIVICPFLQFLMHGSALLHSGPVS